ncbi:D-2-hydroxyacid dehydrogenase [Negadavirga shengliensis]|uniref:D-2-hydroxyacid dehydrogenase n=1 Tax=Negadavirga shengliensis TaxID=1389218 RepID=A0ABV9SVD9_9BACT
MKNRSLTGNRRKFLKTMAQNGLLISAGSMLPAGSAFAYGGEAVASDHTKRREGPLRIWLSSGLDPDLEQQVRSISNEIILVKAAGNAEKASFLPEIEACFGFINEADLKKAGNMKWVHSMSAGVENYLYPEMIHRDEIMLTNAKGCYGPAIAEHTFGLLFSLTRGIKEQSLNMTSSRWKGVDRQVEMRDLTMGIVGFGGIGREIARRAKAMDLKVVAADIRPLTQETTGNMVDELYDMNFGGLDKVLEQANILVSAVPHTRKTEGMFDWEVFKKLPEDAYFINISRGKVTNTRDLMRALDEGKLAGAGLDVTDPEPLPADHALWKYPNVIVTSHISGRSQYSHVRSQKVFVENVRRYYHGLPLINPVDKAAGF